MKRNVSSDPPYKSSDLGHPLPDSKYAVSVSLPTWDSVIGYEEGRDSVINKLQTGYPRFFVSPIIKSLEFNVLRDLNLSSDQRCLLFDVENTAVRCQKFIVDRTDGWEVLIKPIFHGKAYAVVFPIQIEHVAKKFWRFFGEGVSVRRAKSFLANRTDEKNQGGEAVDQIKEKISQDTGQDIENIFIYPSGMAAVSATHRALTKIRPNARSVQFDFPYVDVLKLQQEIGSGVIFLPSADSESITKLKDIIDKGELLCGIYCEVPSNPLLRSADLAAIKSIVNSCNTPIVVDDTVATNVNVNVLKYADVVTTSLTKYYSGAGDVIAGAVIVNSSSAHAEEIISQLKNQGDACLFFEDALVLRNNMSDYSQRIARINETTPRLVDLLMEEPLIEKVWYPKYETRQSYDAVRRSGGGFSGLFSMKLKNSEEKAQHFYDALKLCKGPSLGANFTLVCPYTLLAHYDELDWCEKHGVSKWLIRISVGLESYEFLSKRILEALDEIR
ncbi:MAG: PLP-dependent transferase [Verrucomicrobia bacterium]|nr:MAG: PLP-dependent transferase [Verrucomicrobiota bacterium]